MNVSELELTHLSRVRGAAINQLGRRDLAAWIEKNTYIGGKLFSFKDHEYQHKILDDEAPELVIRKSAQTGISELCLRSAAGLVMIMPGSFRIGYTFPTATFAGDYAKTRFNPIVTTSPALRSAISSDDIDKAEIKTFGVGKEIYFKGAATGNAAISTTLDMLIHDELSFSDDDVIGDYSSRVIHSAYKWKWSLSTPTYPGDPIDLAFSASRRNWNLCRCHHCGNRFVPDYYEHVKIPGWNKHLDEITKENLHLVDYAHAQFLCPKCGREASLQLEHREWVCENPSENHIATGIQVQPFDAPNVVTLQDLIIGSTKYATKTKFRQFALGRPAADGENGLIADDLERCAVQIAQSPCSTHVLGIDLGLVCHFVVGGVLPDGRVIAVHRRRVPLRDFRQEYAAICTQYRITVKVSDIQPYTDLIMSLSETDPMLFGGVYVSRGSMEVYDVRKKDEDRQSALANLRQVNINRNALFDKIMSMMRPAPDAEPEILFNRGDDWELFKTHMTDMKRATATLRNGEFTSMWQKSNRGNDHYHHAVGYMWVAAQIRGVAGSSAGVALSAPVGKFKVKSR